VRDPQRLVDAARARPQPASGNVPTFAVEDDVAAERAFDGLMQYFGADRARAEVRLVVGGEEVGYVAREDLYGRAIVIDRGVGGGGSPYGGSGRANLPGTSTGGHVHALHCPVPHCPEPPLLTMSYDEDHPPHCAAHPDTALIMDGA
jgi:hypothetical protein